MRKVEFLWTLGGEISPLSDPSELKLQEGETQIYMEKHIPSGYGARVFSTAVYFLQAEENDKILPDISPNTYKKLL